MDTVRVVAAGSGGTVLRHGVHAALIGPDCPAATSAAVSAAVKTADQAGRRPTSGELAGLGSGPYAAIVCTRTGWIVALGDDVTLVTDHVGYRSVRRGRSVALLYDAVWLSVALGSGATPGLDVIAAGRNARDGARSGRILAVDTGVAVGVPGGPVAALRCRCEAVFHPRSLWCPRCQTVPERNREKVVATPIAPAWLRLDDGSRRALAGRVVIGRDPTRDPDVVAGRASALQLDDTERSVSRVHAEMATGTDWTPTVQHRGGINGTFVRPKGSDDGRLLTAEDTTPVLLGSVIRMGRRWLSIDA